MGKTRSIAQKSVLTKKHPHARGEDGVHAELRRDGQETPPRTWGRRSYASLSSSSRGNTPTHVGKTATRAGVRYGIRKHPHARGEDQRGGRDGLRDAGNTPTHVGKTIRHAVIAALKEKHPHARGEDCLQLFQRELYQETPPRTWGRRPLPNGRL